MRKLFFIYFLFQVGISFGQNVKIEITDYSRLDEKEYSTFQYVNSSFSFSRPTLVLITNKDLFVELSKKLYISYKAKQEYTDVWILGIANFNQKNISELDKKIIEKFLQKITKYRTDNNLPEYTMQTLEADKVFIDNKEEICRYLSCRNKS
jgi:predicted transport protein